MSEIPIVPVPKRKTSSTINITLQQDVAIPVIKSNLNVKLAENVDVEPEANIVESTAAITLQTDPKNFKREVSVATTEASITPQTAVISSQQHLCTQNSDSENISNATISTTSNLTAITKTTTEVNVNNISATTVVNADLKTEEPQGNLPPLENSQEGRSKTSSKTPTVSHLSKKQKKSIKKSKRRAQKKAARRASSTSTTESSSYEKPTTETDSDEVKLKAVKEETGSRLNTEKFQNTNLVETQNKTFENATKTANDQIRETPKEKPFIFQIENPEINSPEIQLVTKISKPENVDIKTSTVVQIPQNKQDTIPIPPKRSRIPISRQRSITNNEPKLTDFAPGNSRIPIKSSVVKNKPVQEITTSSDSSKILNTVSPLSLKNNEKKDKAKENCVEIAEPNVITPEQPSTSQANVQCGTSQQKSEEIADEMMQGVQAVKELNKQLNCKQSKRNNFGSLRNSSVESTTSSKQMSYTKSLDNDSDSSVSDSNVEELLDLSADEDSYEEFEEYEEIEESDSEEYNKFDETNNQLVGQLNINLSSISAKVDKLTSNLTKSKINNSYIEETCESDEFESEEFEPEDENQNEKEGKIEEQDEENKNSLVNNIIELKQPTESEIMEVRKRVEKVLKIISNKVILTLFLNYFFRDKPGGY